MTDKEKRAALIRAAFMKELEELCRKYKQYIDACGCCDSPWISDVPGCHGETAWDHKKDGFR
jgi:hypothetical protein